jgi:hypothetical protein
LTLEHPEDFRTEDELETLVEATLGSRFLGDCRVSVFEGWPIPNEQAFPPVWRRYETAVSASAPTARPADCVYVSVYEFILPSDDEDFVEGAQVVYVGPNETRAFSSLQGKHGYIESWSGGERIAVSTKY